MKRHLDLVSAGVDLKTHLKSHAIYGQGLECHIKPMPESMDR